MRSVIRSVSLAVTCALGALFAAGSTTQTAVVCVNPQPSIGCSPVNGVYAVTVTFTADTDGSVPTLNLARGGPVLPDTDGLYIYEIDTFPGSPAPTDNWDIVMANSRGLDLMGGGCLNRDTSTKERCFAASANPPLNGNTTITITGNSQNGAQGVLVIYMAVNGALRASAGGTGSITTIDAIMGGCLTVTNGTGPTVSVGIDAPATVPCGGTGATTLTAHGVLVGEAANAIAATSAGTSGQCLASNGASADPSFQNCALNLGNAVTRVNGTTITVSASDATGFATGAGATNTTTLATFTIDTRVITAIADLGGSPKQTRLTFASAWATTVMSIADVVGICGAAGTGTSGLNNLFTIQDRSDTTHADIILDSTGMTYDASSATAGCNAAATGYVYFAGDDAGTVQAQVPSASGLILTSTGGPTTINQTLSPTYGGEPFGAVAITAGAFSGTAINARTAQRAWPVYSGNSGINCLQGSSGTTCSTTADVMSKSGTNAVTGIMDLRLSSASYLPGSNTLPATCTLGQVYIDQNATAGAQFYVCTATNTWTVQGGSGTILGSISTTSGSVPVGTGTANTVTDFGANFNYDNGTPRLTIGNRGSTGYVVAGQTTAATRGGFYLGESSPSSTNYAISGEDGYTAINASSSGVGGLMQFNIDNNNLLYMQTTGIVSGVPFKTPVYQTATNCADSAGAAACGSASAGRVVIDAGNTSVVVSTTAVTANSEIIPVHDISLGTALSVTCNTAVATTGIPYISARTAGTSFTLSITGTLAVDPGCFSYSIVN